MLDLAPLPFRNFSASRTLSLLYIPGMFFTLSLLPIFSILVPSGCFQKPRCKSEGFCAVMRTDRSIQCCRSNSPRAVLYARAVALLVLWYWRQASTPDSWLILVLSPDDTRWAWFVSIAPDCRSWEDQMWVMPSSEQPGHRYVCRLHYGCFIAW